MQLFKEVLFFSEKDISGLTVGTQPRGTFLEADQLYWWQTVEERLLNDGTVATDQQGQPIMEVQPSSTDVGMLLRLRRDMSRDHWQDCPFPVSYSLAMQIASNLPSP